MVLLGFAQKTGEKGLEREVWILARANLWAKIIYTYAMCLYNIYAKFYSFDFKMNFFLSQIQNQVVVPSIDTSHAYMSFSS